MNILKGINKQVAINDLKYMLMIVLVSVAFLLVGAVLEPMTIAEMTMLYIVIAFIGFMGVKDLDL